MTTSYYNIGIRVGSSADDPMFPLYRRLAVENNMSGYPAAVVWLDRADGRFLATNSPSVADAIQWWGRQDWPRAAKYAVLFDNQNMPARRVREYFPEGSYDVDVGAISASQFANTAKDLADHSQSKHVVVSVDIKGVGTVAGFDTPAEAAKLYGDLGDLPGDAVYFALFDKTQADLADNHFLKEEALNTATQRETFHTKTVKTHTRQSALGWVAAGVAGLAGVLAVGKKGRHHAK